MFRLEFWRRRGTRRNVWVSVVRDRKGRFVTHSFSFFRTTIGYNFHVHREYMSIMAHQISAVPLEPHEIEILRQLALEHLEGYLNHSMDDWWFTPTRVIVGEEFNEPVAAEEEEINFWIEQL